MTANAGPPLVRVQWLAVLDRHGDRLKLRVIRMSGAPGRCFWPGFRVGLFALGLGLWRLAAPVGATPTLEQEQEIRTSFVTPPTPWAKPYVGGTTRVLFFSDDKNTQACEIVEWMQRFDVQADAGYWTRGWEKPRRLLNTALQQVGE